MGEVGLILSEGRDIGRGKVLVCLIQVLHSKVIKALMVFDYYFIGWIMILIWGM